MSQAGDRPGISVANHPRGALAVRRTRAWGGLVGVALCGLLSLKAGLPTLDVMLRALAGGIAGWLILWFAAVTVARELVIAEVRVKHAEMLAAAEARAAKAPGADARPV